MPRRPRSILFKRAVPIAALILGSALACELLSILLVHIPGLQSQGSANAGDAFGAAAASGSVVVLYYMARSLHIQQGEAVDQRRELHKQRVALQQTVEASIRSRHIELMRIAMEDPELAATWPSFRADRPQERNKQFLYISAVLSMHLLAYETGYPEAEIESTLRRLFSRSPLWREFWAENADARAQTAVADTTKTRFDALVDRAFRSAPAAAPAPAPASPSDCASASADSRSGVSDAAA
jgi:hypothetical protein